jgi:hypothetical protein
MRAPTRSDYHIICLDFSGDPGIVTYEFDEQSAGTYPVPAGLVGSLLRRLVPGRASRS